MGKTRYYHPDYRQAEVTAIIAALDQGQSVSVIGPPSVGKTNLLRFLDQERLAANDPNSPWRRYAPNTRQQGSLITVNIDPNGLLPALPREKGDVAARAWPGFELLTHRTTIAPQLYPAYKGPTDPPPDPALLEQIAAYQEQFANAHPDVTDFEDHLHAHLALRHLESIIDATLNSHRAQGLPVRLVYFMDEFERLLDTMPDYFFVALRSLRDRFKYSVLFVTFTRNSLPYLIGDRVEVLEPFIELFHDATVYLRPFTDDDAWRMIEQLENRAVAKEDYGLGLLIRATGGFAGLLRAGFKHADALQQIRAQQLGEAIRLAAHRLSAETNVQAECETLLRGLRDEEIAGLYAAELQSGGVTRPVLRELVHKSLLAPDADGEGVHVTPPVLAAYIRNHPTPPSARPPAPPVTLPEL